MLYSGRERSLLHSIAQIRRCTRNEAIARPGRTSKDLILVLQGQCEMYVNSGSPNKGRFVVATVGVGEFLLDVDYFCGPQTNGEENLNRPPYITGAPVQLSLGALALSECQLLYVSHIDLTRVLWTDTVKRMQKAAEVKMSWRRSRLNRQQQARDARQKVLQDQKVGLKALPRSANVDTSQLSLSIVTNISRMRYVHLGRARSYAPISLQSIARSQRCKRMKLIQV